MLTLLLAHTNLICWLSIPYQNPIPCHLPVPHNLQSSSTGPNNTSSPPVNQPPTTIPSVKIRRHCNKTEIHLPIPFSTLAQETQKCLNAQLQGSLTQRFLLRPQQASINRTFHSPIELPQVPILGLRKANKMLIVLLTRI